MNLTKGPGWREYGYAAPDEDLILVIRPCSLAVSDYGRRIWPGAWCIDEAFTVAGEPRDMPTWVTDGVSFQVMRSYGRLTDLRAALRRHEERVARYGQA